MRMENQTDEALLIRRCKQELPYNHSSFEELVSRYKDYVFTLCYRIAGKSTDAEDLTQEVFTKVFLNLKNFEERSKFSSWIYRIAHNQAVDFVNRRKREAEVIGEYTAEKKSSGKDSDVDAMSGKMQSALDQLPPEQRSLLVMKYVIGLDLKEISESQELSLAAVKMRLLRARNEFRELYEK